MCKRLAAAAVGLWLLAMAPADALARELTPAQERVKSCNTRAKDKGLDGAERGKFMNACLNGRGKPAELTVRQERHERCNAIAKERALEGAERRGYMTECEKPPAVKNAGARDRALDCERRAAGRRLEGDERRDYVKGCLAAAGEESR